MSNYGRVKNIETGNILTGDINNGGYRRVGMYNSRVPVRKFVHRLVAEHFIENPHSREMVNHIDGDKLNNHHSNLEWVTGEQNMQHASDMGFLKGVSKPVTVETLDDEIIQLPSISEASKFIGVSDTTLRHWVKYNKKDTYYNYNIKNIDIK